MRVGRRRRWDLTGSHGHLAPSGGQLGGNRLNRVCVFTYPLDCFAVLYKALTIQRCDLGGKRAHNIYFPDHPLLGRHSESNRLQSSQTVAPAAINSIQDPFQVRMSKFTNPL